jgi:hypothetical protein
MDASSLSLSHYSTTAVASQKGGQLTTKEAPSFRFPNISEAMTSLKDYVFKPSEIYKKIRNLAKNVSEGGTVLSNDDMNLIAQAFKIQEYPQLRTYISDIFIHLDNKPEQLNFILKKAFSYSDDKGAKEIVAKISSLLTLQKIELIIQSELTGFEGAFKDVLKISKISSKEIDRKAEEKKATIIQTIKVTVENLLEFALDTVLKAFQIDSIGEETEDDGQAYFRVMIFTSIGASCTSILASLAGILGSAALTAVVAAAAVLVIGVGLFCYYKWLKPCPQECSPFTNLTTLAKKGELKEVVGRDPEIKAVMKALVANKGGIRRHPLVVAKSGLGKTTTAEGMAVKIGRGDPKVLEELRGKQVFYVNIAKLCSEMTKMGRSKMDVLSKVQKKMHKYKDQCIFIFDEFAKALSDPNNQSVAANLLSFMDTSPGSFPYCLALTTEEEYWKHIVNNGPLVRRTKLIPMDMMNEMSTKLLLYHMAKQEAPELDIDKEVFDTIYELTTKDLPNKPQPLTSLTVLNDALVKIRSVNSSSLRDLEEKLTKQLKDVGPEDQKELMQELSNLVNILDKIQGKKRPAQEVQPGQPLSNSPLKTHEIHENLESVSIETAIQLLQQRSKEYEEIFNRREDTRTFSKEGIKLFNDYETNEELIESLQVLHAEEQKNYEKYFEWKRKQLDYKKTMKDKAIQIAYMKEGEARNNLLKDHVLHNYYVNPALISKVQEEQVHFHRNFPKAKTKVDLALIKEIIKEHADRSLKETLQTALQNKEKNKSAKMSNTLIQQNTKALNRIASILEKSA